MTTLLTRATLRIRPLLERAARAHTDRGATAVEYALMMAFIAIVIVASVILLGRNLSTFFNNTSNSI